MFQQVSSQSTLQSSAHYDSDLEKGYHSDGQASESCSDFSANVSDFEGSSVSKRDNVDGSYGSVGSSSTYETDSDRTSVESEDSEDDSSVDDSSLYSESVSNSHVFQSQPATFLTQGRSKLAGELVSIIPGQTEQSAIPQRKECSSLIQAVKNGDLSLVRQLLKGRCSLNATDSVMRTALHVACGFGRVDIVRVLITSGGNVDACSASGQTPLHEACIGGHYNVLKILISEVSDLDAVDKNGMSAAHYCALNGEVGCLTLLCNQVW